MSWIIMHHTVNTRVSPSPMCSQENAALYIKEGLVNKREESDPPAVPTR